MQIKSNIFRRSTKKNFFCMTDCPNHSLSYLYEIKSCFYLIICPLPKNNNYHLFKDEKNQVLTTNIWLEQVSYDL
jgi:hypothetical protein